MADIIPDDGIRWVTDRVMDAVDEEIDVVAIGVGESEPTEDDTSLDNEVYRAEKTRDNCTIETGDGLGEIDFSLTVSGGTEVDGGVEITEVGLLTDSDRLLFRELRLPITIDSGETVTFSAGVDITR